MKLKFKILSGFALIIGMLIIAGFMSIYEFSKLSGSVNALIEDNYKTIEASKTMIEALEREDSGILLLVSGQWKEGRDILKSADSLFYDAFEVAKNNLTEKDEDKYVEQVERSYLAFKEKWVIPIVGTSKENSITWYFKDLHPSFIAAKSDVQSLMTLNQDSMHDESSDLKEKAHRALMPGIIAIISALIFLIMFNFLISKYYVKPLESIIQSLKEYRLQDPHFNAGIESSDEFKELEKEIQNLIQKVKLSD